MGCLTQSAAVKQHTAEMLWTVANEDGLKQLGTKDTPIPQLPRGDLR